MRYCQELSNEQSTKNENGQPKRQILNTRNSNVNKKNIKIGLRRFVNVPTQVLNDVVSCRLCAFR